MVGLANLLVPPLWFYLLLWIAIGVLVYAAWRAIDSHWRGSTDRTDGR